MVLKEFQIGASFWTPTGEWVCTDIGTRSITAVRAAPDRIKYTSVFDAFDMEGCFKTEQEMKDQLGV